MNHSPTVRATVLLSLIVASMTTGADSSAAETQPNIIFIMADDLDQLRISSLSITAK